MLFQSTTICKWLVTFGTGKWLFSCVDLLMTFSKYHKVHLRERQNSEQNWVVGKKVEHGRFRRPPACVPHCDGRPSMSAWIFGVESPTHEGGWDPRRLPLVAAQLDRWAFSYKKKCHSCWMKHDKGFSAVWMPKWFNASMKACVFKSESWLKTQKGKFRANSSLSF